MQPFEIKTFRLMCIVWRIAMICMCVTRLTAISCTQEVCIFKINWEIRVEWLTLKADLSLKHSTLLQCLCAHHLYKLSAFCMCESQSLSPPAGEEKQMYSYLTVLLCRKLWSCQTGSRVGKSATISVNVVFSKSMNNVRNWLLLKAHPSTSMKPKHICFWLLNSCFGFWIC